MEFDNVFESLPSALQSGGGGNVSFQVSMDLQSGSWLILKPGEYVHMYVRSTCPMRRQVLRIVRGLARWTEKLNSSGVYVFLGKET